MRKNAGDLPRSLLGKLIALPQFPYLHWGPLRGRKRRGKGWEEGDEESEGREERNWEGRG